MKRKKEKELLRENKGGLLLLLASLFIAGFLAMAYEVFWQRMLSLTLGATLRSSALVLSCYMIGMGLGAWRIGKLTERSGNRIRLIAWLHLGMALSGLWGMGLIGAIPHVYRHVPGAASEILAHLAAVMAVLPGAAAFGGMLPATAGAYITDNRKLGIGIGLLYSLEALGSLLGVAAAGFLLIRILGQMGALAGCLAVNLTAGAALMLFRSGESKSEAIGEGKPRRSSWRPVGDEVIQLLIALALGFIGMSLQVVWNRAVRIYLPNSSYTFTMVAFVYLAGFSGGNLAFRAAVGKLRRPASGLFAVLTALALVLAAGVWLLAKAPDLLLFPLADLLSRPATRIFLPPLAVTAGLAFIPTFLFGFGSPLACRLYADRVESVGGDIGLWRGVNTLGSALGPAAAGMILLPLAGVTRSLWLAAAMAAAAAAMAAYLERRQTVRWLLGLAGAAAFLSLAVFSKPVMVLPPSMHREAGASSRGDRIIHYRETAEGTVIVAEDVRTGIRACFVNNSAVVGTTYDAIKAVKMLGHLPILLGDRPRRALVIGFGIGVTASTVASHPSVEEVDCVEITPGVRLAAPFFNEFNRGVITNPKLRFIDGDGRTYLNRSRKEYDLISADPTHPTLGCAQLYTKEYFELCRSRLSPGGVICQYLPFHGLTPSEFAGAVAAFASVFPHSSLWLGHSHGVLVGSAECLQVEFSVWKQRVESLDDPLFYKNSHALAACLLLDEDGIARLTAGQKPCTDDKNFLEYFHPKAKDQDNWERNLSQALLRSEGTGSIFTSVDDSMLLSRHRAGQRIFLEGLAAQNRGDRPGMIRWMQEAVRAVPENEEFRFLLQQELGRPAR